MRVFQFKNCLYFLECDNFHMNILRNSNKTPKNILIVFSHKQIISDVWESGSTGDEGRQYKLADE